MKLRESPGIVFGYYIRNLLTGEVIYATPCSKTSFFRSVAPFVAPFYALVYTYIALEHGETAWGKYFVGRSVERQIWSILPRTFKDYDLPIVYRDDCLQCGYLAAYPGSPEPSHTGDTK